MLIAMPPLPVVSAKRPPNVGECLLVGQCFAHLRDTAAEKCLTLRFGIWCWQDQCSWELGGWANRENIIESEKFEDLRPSSDQKIKIIFKKSSSLFKDYSFLRTVVVHSLMILKKLSSLRRREEKYKGYLLMMFNKIEVLLMENWTHFVI